MGKELKTPFNVMRNRDWDSHPKAQVVGSYILNAIGATTLATSTIASLVVGSLAMSVVTSFLLRALMPKPPSSSQGLLTNARSALAPHDLVYGQIRKGGTVTFIESTGSKNEYLHQIISLAGHEVEEIGDIYINDEIVAVDGPSGFVSTDKWQDGANSKIRIKKHLGADTQTADTDLVSETSVTSDFKGQGIAYIYVRMQYHKDVFADGIPLFTAVVKGKKVFDNRNTTTAYSANAALCVRDYLTNEYYGLDNDGAINNTMFDAAANACDENVTLDGGSTQKRYEINGVLRLDQTPSNILADMMSACAGTLFWGQGKWQLKAGVYSSSVKTFTLDDLRSDITLQTKRSRRDNFNIVNGTFINKDQGYISADYPEQRSTTFIANDAGVESTLDLQLPLTTNSAMAQRLAKLTLFRTREQMTFSADFSLNALNVQVGDVISLDIDRYGWSSPYKEFEVVGWKFSNSSDAGDLRITLDLAETSSAAYSWSAEESAINGNNATFPDTRTGLDITNVAVSQATFLAPDGTHFVNASASWDDVDNAFLRNYFVQWQKTSLISSGYRAFYTEDNSTTIGPLEDGQGYTVRVSAININGFTGTVTSTTFTATADTSPPSLPTSISATGGFRENFIEWTNPTENDFAAVNVYASSSNSSGSASLVGTISGSAFAHGGLNPSTTKYYFLKSADNVGNLSAFTASVSATTRADPTNGLNGANGNPGARYATVRYYQELSTSPSTTGLLSNLSYTWSTGVSTASYSSWTTTGPLVSAVDADNFWYVDVVFIDTSGTATSSAGSSVTTPRNFLNFNGLVTFTNASGTTPLNTALADSSTQIDGGRITTDTIIADKIKIDNITLDSDGSGNLIIKDGGVGTDQLAAGSVTNSTQSGLTSFSLAANAAKTVTVSLTNCTAGSEILLIFNYTTASSTAGDAFDLVGVNTPSGNAYNASISNAPVQNFIALPSAMVLRTTASAGTNTIGITITARSGNTSSLVGIIYGLIAQEYKK